MPVDHIQAAIWRELKIDRAEVTVFADEQVEYVKDQTALISFAEDINADTAVAIGDLFEIEIIQVGATTPGGNGFYMGVLY